MWEVDGRDAAEIVARMLLEVWRLRIRPRRTRRGLSKGSAATPGRERRNWISRRILAPVSATLAIKPLLLASRYGVQVAQAAVQWRQSL